MTIIFIIYFASIYYLFSKNFYSQVFTVGKELFNAKAEDILFKRCFITPKQNVFETLLILFILVKK